MLKEAERVFDEILNTSKNDQNILGLFLGGSRGKGLPTTSSDYDVVLIVKNGKSGFYKNRFKYVEGIKGIDVYVASLHEFEKHAYFGGPEEWNRYSFTHVKALIDKNSRIQRLINEKGKIPKDKIRDFISRNLDGYINYVYRSMKCFRDKNIVGARLEAAYSIPLFFDVIFAIHDGRLRPYYKYLEWEMASFPLRKFPMEPKTIIRNVLKILGTADVKKQQELFRNVEKVLRREGYGNVFDDWGIRIDWIKNFNK
jgi:hypothetical protein